MTENEIRKRIKSEERRIKRNAERIAEIKADTEATRRMIGFWKRELKRFYGASARPPKRGID